MPLTKRRDTRAPERRYIVGEAKRAHLLETATDLFGRHGYEAVGVRSLAEAADVNLSAITYYFGGKEGLYRATLEHLVREIEGLIGVELAQLSQRVAAAGKDRRKLEHVASDFVQSWARLTLGSPAVQRRMPFVSRELSAPSQFFDILYNGFFRGMYDALERLILAARGLSRGSVETDIHVHAVASQMLGFIANEHVFWKRTGWKGYSKARIDLLVPHLTAIVLTAIGFNAGRGSAA